MHARHGRRLAPHLHQELKDFRRGIPDPLTHCWADHPPWAQGIQLKMGACGECLVTGFGLQCRHLIRPDAVQGVLHAHLLITPQPDHAGNSASQAPAIPRVAQKALRMRTLSDL